MKSKLGMIVSIVYLAVALYFISTQGLAGESFIALILGMPWTLVLAFFEFGGVQGMFLTILLIAPILLNAFLLYKLGTYIGMRL